MPELRDYQQELLKQAETALQAPDARVMLQLPTGGGKTHIAGVLLARRLSDGRKAAWLTHRTELAEQTRRMLEGSGVLAINNLSWRVGDAAPYLNNGAVILMAQTVGRRANNEEIWSSYDNNDLLVIDEAHHAAAEGWERAIRQWPGPVIGLTATPWRLSKTEGFDHLFKELRCGPQVSQLQAGDWLCQVRFAYAAAAGRHTRRRNQYHRRVQRIGNQAGQQRPLRRYDRGSAPLLAVPRRRAPNRHLRHIPRPRP